MAARTSRTASRRRRFVPPEDLRELDRAFVRCRTLGHAWDDFIPMRKPAQFGDRLSLRCVRCATERHDIVSWVDGSLLQREYQHPEGYALAEHHSRSEFRATLMVIRKEEARQAAREARDVEIDVTDTAVARMGNGSRSHSGSRSRGRARAIAGRR